MNIKMKVLISSLVMLLATTTDTFGYVLWINNSTDGNIEAEIELDACKNQSLIIPSGEYAHFSTGTCCFEEIKVTKKSGTNTGRSPGWKRGYDMGFGIGFGTTCSSYGIKVEDSDKVNVFNFSTDFIQSNKNVWRIVNKTGHKMGFNLITSGCLGIENNEGDSSCNIFGSIKGIMFNGKSDDPVMVQNAMEGNSVKNLYKVLPWNGKITSDAVFFVRKMTDTEKKVLATGYKDPGAVDERFENISGVFQGTAYREAEYIIELHHEGSK